jgi:hypothetical protein
VSANWGPGVLLCYGLVLAPLACGSDPVRKPAEGANPDCEAAPESCEPPANETDYVSFEVFADRPVYLNLAARAVVEPADPSRSNEWDLSFHGYEIYTNGGISGPGVGSSFGPLPASFFAFPDEPIVSPFLIEDRAEGAFRRWYAYDGAEHVIYSRYHVYGVRSHDVLYKLQVMSYYGEVAASPVSALYRLRYAVVGASGSEPATDLADIDGTSGGGDDPAAASGCVSLATGATTLFTPDEASASPDWDLCFRRDVISVNGERGGPGGVSAVDLAGGTDEPVGEVKGLTNADIDARFDGVDATALTAGELEYRGDYVTSAFTRKWADLSVAPPVPITSNAWLVVGANGVSRYLVGFDSFEGATAEAPGVLKLYVHPSP